MIGYRDELAPKGGAEVVRCVRRSLGGAQEGNSIGVVIVEMADLTHAMEGTGKTVIVN